MLGAERATVGDRDMHLDLGEEVDSDPLGLQAAGLFDPHAKVLHVRQDDVLHGSAAGTHRDTAAASSLIAAL